MRKWLMIAFVIFLGSTVGSVSPCTIFNASKNGLVLAGNNEDGSSTNTNVWFVPASKGKYGVVWVGFDKNLSKMGAMNDQGLFFDANALKFAKMNPHPEKLSFNQEKDVWARMMSAWEKVMQECAGVNEVLEMLKKHNLEGWDNLQLMFADKSGASAVVGADKNGELAVTPKKGDYQVSTNFNVASPEFGAFSYPCQRYNIATEMLEAMKELTVDYARSILAAVHAEGSSATIYSNICDLTHGDIYIYNFHNFGEVVRFNLAEELKKGEKLYSFASLFPRKSYAQTSFETSRDNTLTAVLRQTMAKEGLKAAIQKYHKIKDNYSPVPGQLFMFAYGFFQIGKIGEAIEIVELSAAEFPRIPETFKFLGDLYLRQNNNEQAIKNYKKSLELKPENKEVIDILNRIQK